MSIYRGRIAPTPTGFIHAGHAMTFWSAQERAREHGGQSVLRVEDLDEARCRPEFREALLDDLRWFGLEWDEGPDTGGQFAPYEQSRRREHYLRAWRKLRDADVVYPCFCSRRDVAIASLAPHAEDEEPIYPGTCRPVAAQPVLSGVDLVAAERPVEAAVSAAQLPTTRRPLQPAGVTWRFRVPDGEKIRFTDQLAGPQAAIAGRDFGDFVVWRKDDVAAYQLAVVVDDIEMKISEVVRGADLLLSTFRQLLLYRALGEAPPVFCHVPLIRDEKGERLAKRHAALSLRALRESGVTPEEIRRRYVQQRNF